MKTACSLLILIAALSAQRAAGDTVVLNNGQRLIGAVTIRGPMVHVRDDAGRVHSVNLALVKTIQRSPYYSKQRGPQETNRGPAPSTNWRARIEAKLDERMSVDFDKTSIKDVVAFLRAQTGINIILSPEVPEDTTVTLSVKDMTLRNILHWIVSNAGVGLTSRDEALLIAPKEALVSDQTIVAMDVRDLTLAVIDRPRRPNVLGEAPQGLNASQFGLGGGGGAHGGILRDNKGRDLADIELQKRGKEIVKFLVHMTGPDGWAPAPAYIVPHLADDSD